MKKPLEFAHEHKLLVAMFPVLQCMHVDHNTDCRAAVAAIKGRDAEWEADLARLRAENERLRKGTESCVDDDGTPFASARIWRYYYQNETRALSVERAAHAVTREALEREKAKAEQVAVDCGGVARADFPRWRLVDDGAAPPAPAAPPTEQQYPCADCGTLRTAAEGGTTFTVCDACWDKAYLARAAAPAPPAVPPEGLRQLLDVVRGIAADNDGDTNGWSSPARAALAAWRNETGSNENA